MKVAVLQMTSGPDMEENFEQVSRLAREAAGKGATFIATPEVTDQVIAKRAEKIAQHFTPEDHPGMTYFAELAKELGVWLLIGSMCMRVSEDKLANRSVLFTPQGNVKATYDKIHLFDVDLPNGETYRESDSFQAGTESVLTEVGGHKLGMTICYDMRFPHIYRDLGKAGADIITVPAAFTVPTGEAHWHSLLRARAIETGAFVIAPAQVGDHAGIRKTYGHSLIIDPWGIILAEAEQDRPCMIMADLDFALVDKARRAVPSLRHDRDYVEILKN